MSRPSQPELKKFMDRRIYLHVQGGRAVSGVLRGFDIFLNLVLDQASEELGGGQKKPCGMIRKEVERRVQTSGNGKPAKEEKGHADQVGYSR